MITEGIDKNILFVSFEDLTSNPEIELNKIYDFFGVEKFKHDFQNVEQLTQEDDTLYGIFGDHKIRKEVKPLSESYNEYLGQQLSQNIVNTYPWFYEYFNYNV